VLANRLSENPALRVLLLEAGPPDRKLDIHIPAAWTRTLKTDVDWTYFTEPETGLHDRRLFWPRGKTLGGSSAINAMIYMRGNRFDYDHWALLDCPGWSYDDVLPYFKKMQHQERGESAYHSVGGPLNVADLRDPNPMARAFVDAAAHRGIPKNGDFNGADHEGVGLFQVTQKDGLRHSAAAAYLKPVLDRPNLKVITGAHATRILIHEGRATGIAYRLDGLPREAHARREVLLCGGAVNSPQLLLLSGIGPGDALQALGLPVVSDLQGVGQNLQDHLISGVIRYTFQPVSLASATKPRALLRYALSRRGLLTSNVAEAGAFVRFDADAPAPDVQYHFGPAHFVDHGQTPLDGHGYAAGGLVLRPRSRGTISLHSADPLAAPRIQPNYLSDDQGYDLRLTLQALKLAREILSAPSFDAYRGAELLPGADVQSDDDLIYYIREKAETLYHPVGTCKMGTDPLAVVDAALRVRGVDGLRVVDASIMPTITSGNTNAPVMMIAEKAADLIKAANGV
jgi:choline dehydrogenase